jgi:predicted membrane-bound dolichyl-phosphate-mannose-protein mannosyltransferase
MVAYRDELIYVECGLKYISGLPPFECNFEHPPFAKYFIGLFSILGIARFIYVGLALASGVLLYLLVRNFSSGNWICGLTVFLFFLFDTIVFNTHKFLLLDPVALFFALLSVYLFQRGYYSVSAVVAGLAVASKYSVAPIVAGLWLLLLFKDKRFKESLAYLALAFTTYFSTFIMDLRLGLDGVIRHHVEMFKYMSWRHGFSPGIVALGFMKLIARVEAWRYSGEFTLYIYTSGSMVGLVNETYTPVNKWYLVVYIGGGSPLWYTLLPSLIYATYLVLTSKESRGLNLSVFLSWLSLLNVLAGPIDWYYVNTLPFLYMTLVILIQQITPRHYKWILLLLTAIHIASFTLTTLGLIPFRVVFVS